jgi:acyl carrier protein
MSKDVMDRLAGLIRETFSQPKAKIDRNTLAEDIPGWDSLSHTILMLSVEDTVAYANVGELADAIVRHGKG